MTFSQVLGEIEAIKTMAGDNEAAAHAREDALHQSVLHAIATGEIEPENAAGYARAALLTRSIDFERWFA